MRLSKIIVWTGAAVALTIVAAALAAQFLFWRISPAASIPTPSTTTPGDQNTSLSGQSAMPQNAFPQGSAAGSGSLAGSVPSYASTPSASRQYPIYNGSPVSSLAAVQSIIAAATTSAPAPGVAALSLPSVADTDIAIDPSGVATMQDYLAYFNARVVNGIVFDNARFATVLKDGNGVPLPPQDLIEKTMADGDFSGARGSLTVERDFVAAEIAFLKKIKVTGSAVALDKETIGTEELLLDEIDKALAVGSGSLSAKDFALFEAEFSMTINNAHAQFLKDSGVLSIAKPQSWLDRVLAIVGLTAKAQSTTNLPFGGELAVLVPCPCDAGVWVTIGPPASASVFVSVAFLSTPLFYANKSLVAGVWWLGLYNPLVQIPCLSGASCSSVGKGGAIVMVGTGAVPGP